MWFCSGFFLASLKTVSPVFQKVAVNIFNTSSGRSVRSVTTGSSAEPCSPDILEDSSIIKWIKDVCTGFIDLQLVLVQNLVWEITPVSMPYTFKLKFY